MTDRLRNGATAGTRAIPKHKFSVGMAVVLTLSGKQSIYKVTRLLPEGGAGLQYRIKADGETYERVASEALLTRA